MSGLYIHIPYCSQKCIYCDFFSVATRKSKKEYLQALVKEMQNRKSYLSNPIRTLYFGGGTPTNLDFEEMNIDPKNPKMENRDRFVLSAGHGAPMLYATLYMLGYLIL